LLDNGNYANNPLKSAINSKNEPINRYYGPMVTNFEPISIKNEPIPFIWVNISNKLLQYFERYTFLEEISLILPNFV